jgi:hypothetical protein
MDTALEFVRFAAEIIFWYFVFSLLINFVFNKQSKEKKELESQIETLKSYVHPVNVEQHGDMSYWFDAKTDEFLAQGKTTEDLAATLKSRFPNHIFILADEKTSYFMSSATDWRLEVYKSTT